MARRQELPGKADRGLDAAASDLRGTGVVRGPIFWVVAGATKKRSYQPGPEGLSYLWWKRGGECHLYRPCVFHRVGIPGSGGAAADHAANGGSAEYLRADWEYVLCLKRPGKLPWADTLAMGHPPKWAPGGEMSNRLTDGTRVNQLGKTGEQTAVAGGNGDKPKTSGRRPSHRNAHGVSDTTTRRRQGTDERETQGKPRLRTKGGSPKDSLSKKGQERFGKGRRITRGHQNGDTPNSDSYDPPPIANPGNLVQQLYTADEVAALLAQAGDVSHHNVGGGVMGHDLAHDNEAPFPLTLAEFYTRSFGPPGGILLDCFAGSGTVIHSALKWGRRVIACDLRQSQVNLCLRRAADVAPAIDWEGIFPK